LPPAAAAGFFRYFLFDLVPPKRLVLSELHDITSQTIVLFIVTTLKTLASSIEPSLLVHPETLGPGIAQSV
jgi:hypothetical protein